MFSVPRSARKGGSRFARAQRARRGHGHRRFRETGTGGERHYKGAAKARRKPSWWL